MPNNDTFFSRAIADGQAELTGEGKQQRIRYVAADRTDRFADPEEQVRAEYSVVFHDREQKRPFAVIKCKRDGVFQ